jgi:hypothetical protein
VGSGRRDRSSRERRQSVLHVPRESLALLNYSHAAQACVHTEQVEDRQTAFRSQP